MEGVIRRRGPRHWKTISLYYRYCRTPYQRQLLECASQLVTKRIYRAGSYAKIKNEYYSGPHADSIVGAIDDEGRYLRLWSWAKYLMHRDHDYYHTSTRKEARQLKQQVESFCKREGLKERHS